MSGWQICCITLAGVAGIIGIVKKITIHQRQVELRRGNAPHFMSGRELYVWAITDMVFYACAPLSIFSISFIWWPDPATWAVVTVSILSILTCRPSALFVARLLPPAFSRRVVLENADYSSPLASSGAILRIAHLSDMHISCTNPLEDEGLSGEQTLRTFQEALDWSFEQAPDIVLLTGDLVDSGRPDEWAAFRTVLESRDPEERGRISFVPGNHDLATVRSEAAEAGFAAAANARVRDGYLFMAQEQSSRKFIGAMLPRAEDWRVPVGAETASLAEVLSRVDGYIRAYRDNPPMIGGKKIYLDVLKRPSWDSGRDGIMEPSVHVSPELVKAASEWGGKYSWPSGWRMLYRHLVEELFPIILYETDDFIVIGLNSCVQDTSMLLTSAFGRLGSGQIGRLRQVLDAARSKCKIIAMHHHFGLPGSIPSLNSRVDPIRLIDAVALHDLLKEHENVVVFHGHKHFGFHARCGSIKVVSSPSVLYGDRKGNRASGPNCFFYDVNVHGELSVCAEKRLGVQQR